MYKGFILHSFSLIISPAVSGPHCWIFQYHMFGTHTGSLLIVQGTIYTSETIQWAMHGQQGDQWRQGAVTLSLKQYDQVRFDLFNV